LPEAHSQRPRADLTPNALREACNHFLNAAPVNGKPELIVFLKSFYFDNQQEATSIEQTQAISRIRPELCSLCQQTAAILEFKLHISLGSV